MAGQPPLGQRPLGAEERDAVLNNLLQTVAPMVARMQAGQLQEAVVRQRGLLHSMALLIQGLGVLGVLAVLLILALTGERSSTVSILLGTVAGLIVGTGIGHFYRSDSSQ